MLDNLLILLLVVSSFLPILVVAALIEHYGKFLKEVKDDELAREHREYVEQNLMR